MICSHKRETPPVHPIPERAPDAVVDLTTRPEQALIYRLSGDRNALHADPAVAKKAGYDRPFTTLEDGVTRYVRDYLTSDDSYA